MDLNTVAIAAIVIMIVVFIYLLRHKRKVNTILENNNNVVPLLMQKSTQAKVTRLNQATSNNAQANEQLQKLVVAYKNNQINIQDYNERLDKMLNRLDVEL